MQIHELKVKKGKSRKKIGRGGKRGTYSGKGMKGQKSRSGVSIDPLFEGGRSSLVERLKKLRGFKSPHTKKAVVNVEQLDKKFKNGDEITRENLIKSGLVDKIKKSTGIKILGQGKLSKKLTVGKGIFLSKSAEKAIEKAGGKILKSVSSKKSEDKKIKNPVPVETKKGEKVKK